MPPNDHDYPSLEASRRIGAIRREDFNAHDADARGLPEHAKLHRLYGDNEPVQRFVDWLLDEQGVDLCRWMEGDAFGDGWERIHRTRVQLMHDFFQIDAARLDAEKRRMLDELRAANAVREDDE